MTLDRLRAGYSRVLEWIVIVLMAILFIEVSLGVIYRTIGVSLVWYDEVASILLAWLTFYGSALASVKRAHIGCPELVDLAPPRARAVVRIIAQLATIAFFLLMGWMGYTVLGVLEGDRLVSLPEVPVAWVQSVVPISAVLIVLAELITLPGVVAASLREKRPGGEVEVTGGASH
jgi:TRAP-type C4-dicarboxylate transport system permease small subunit